MERALQRNMDLIRALLLKLEALPMSMGGVVLIKPDTPEIAVEGFNETQIHYHLRLIEEAGLTDNAGARPMLGIGFCGLTWQGHDLLDSIRDPIIWEKTKKGLSAAGGFSVDLLKDLAKGFLRKQVEEFTGVKLQ